MKSARIVCLLLFLTASLLLPWFMRGNWLQTDLTALLPIEKQPDAVWQAADRAQETLLNRQIVILVGGKTLEQAAEAATQTAERWRHSGLFARVDSHILPDIASLRTELQTLDVALLPAAQAALLLEDPQRYFQERAQALFNPFAASLLPMQDDWLGFSRFFPDKQPGSRLQLQDGWLTAEHDGITWLMLRARLDTQPDAAALLDLLAHSKSHAAQHGYRLLAGGGALFAAHARLDAEGESTRMSIAGTLLTLALLLAVFRSLRALLLLVPLACGILLGLAATLAVFGHIHALTLVIGTSLIGVLIDFPLHWLTPALFDRHWHGERAMRQLLPVFLPSLAITALGYLLLWFTPLPVLRQTAVFSSVALCGAFLGTACLLPVLLRRYTPPQRRFALPALPRLVLILALAAAIAGNAFTRWKDDLRDWMPLPDALLADTRQIAAVSGLESAGVYLLVQATDNDALLERDAALLAELQTLIANHQLDAAQGISQWLLPTSRQQILHRHLHALASQPEHFAALLQSGIPAETLRAALLAERRIITLPASLQTALAEPWQNLYLGEIDGQYASIVRLHGLRDNAALQTLAAQTPCTPQACVRLIDKPAHLNALFQDTRNQAAWLKLASWLVAWLALILCFGLRRGSTIIALPLAAAVATLGILGWLGIPVSLFALFGLLLASAIGVDYTLYMLQAKDRHTAKIASMTLAALTTAVSFILLATSHTPAVAGFGLSVTLGVGWNWLLAGNILPIKDDKISQT